MLAVDSVSLKSSNARSSDSAPPYLRALALLCLHFLLCKGEEQHALPPGVLMRMDSPLHTTVLQETPDIGKSEAV